MIDVQRSRMRQLFYRKGKEKWDCRIFPSSFNVERGKKKKPIWGLTCTGQACGRSEPCYSGLPGPPDPRSPPGARSLSPRGSQEGGSWRALWLFPRPRTAAVLGTSGSTCSKRPFQLLLQGPSPLSWHWDRLPPPGQGSVQVPGSRKVKDGVG